MPEKCGPAAVGRPSKFKPEYVEQARKLMQRSAANAYFAIARLSIHRLACQSEACRPTDDRGAAVDFA